MGIWKTNKTRLLPEDILSYITQYEHTEVPRFNTLWQYYQGKNETILGRKAPRVSSSKSEDSFDDTASNKNVPDNKIPIPYGRKIITTFTGYAYRPKYITYKPIDVEDYTVDGNLENKIPVSEQLSFTEKLDNKQFFVELMKNFRINNEHIKTSRAGRNTGIFGVSYELLYIDGVMDAKTLNMNAEVKFITIDPRQMILLYDYSSEPKKVVAIRYYHVSDNQDIVEVYYADTIEIYTRELDSGGNWNLKFVKSAPNFFGEVPVVAYYFGDEMMGLIEPVMPLIDCYDILLSDSMNEFDRFANAYLILKKMSLVDPLKRKEPGAFSQALAKLKRYRVFELQDKDSDVKFLMKDIPFGFIQFMTQFVQKQIHTQSHVPDFAGEKFTGASGIAIQRLLFDFENVCSDAEADFDVGLYERIRLISIIYKKLGRAYGDYSAINISHKRNSPLNLQEFANTASMMKAAGFSRYVIADIMPDDVIPDVEEELKRQDEDAMRMMPTVEQNQLVNELSKSFEQNPPIDESQQVVDESLSNGGTLIE